MLGMLLDREFSVTDGRSGNGKSALVVGDLAIYTKNLKTFEHLLPQPFQHCVVGF